MNAVRVFHYDPTLGADVLWYDEFLDRVCVKDSESRSWRKEDAYRLTVYMQEHAGLVNIADTVVDKAAHLVARQRTKHIVRDWLRALVWDGEPRIDHAFEDHWSAECGPAQPCEYVRAASRNFFIGLVARILRPGCQVDTMVVFEGEQGTRKTSALRVLVSEPWYAVAHESVLRKDFFEVLRGKWLMEIGEMDAFSRVEVTRVKTVISTPTDTYRRSYGHDPEDVPRQCVFAGTTNKDDWGNDDTGLRRFWPLRCGLIQLDTLAAARAQLFAEAVHLCRAGESWWHMPASALDVQSDRQQDHAWTELVMAGLIGFTETTTAEVLMRVLKFDASQITRASELLVGSILRQAGWKKQNLRREGKQGKRWVAQIDE